MTLLDARVQGRVAPSIAGYETLGASYERAAEALAINDMADLRSWQMAVQRLADANLGGATLTAFLALSEAWPADRSPAALAAIGQSAATIGRHAGSAAARSVIAALPVAWRHLPEASDRSAVLASLESLAELAPDCLALVTGRLGALLDGAGPQGFDAWISGGLRACGHDRRQRRAYFALDSALSRRLFGLGQDADLARLDRRLAAGLTALFDVRAPIRPIKAVEDLPVPRRASFAGGLPRLPEAYPGLSGATTDAVYLAAVAHLGAHLRHSRARFAVAALKPVQIALVSLVEDARVEALALAEMPGLARLWRPFHHAPLKGETASALLQRLARGLFDPTLADDHGLVAKGRAMFAAARGRLGDPAISREIGSLLGNDLGQMRVQFNPRTHVVEPVYRDDMMGLWDFGDEAEAVMDDLALAVDAARPRRQDEETGRNRDQPAETDDRQRARPAAAAAVEDGVPVAHYPEWDHALGRRRPDWVTVLECPAPITPPAASGGSDPAVAARVAALARGAAIGRRLCRRGLREGDGLDLEACIAAAVARRAGLPPEERVFHRVMAGPRDLAVVLLLDLSESTADPGPDGRSLLQVECDAAAILAEAIEAAGDAIALHGFRSDGRDKVRAYRLKDFDEPMDVVIGARLAGLASGQSTRLGAAIRHAGTLLAPRRAFRRVLVVLTDGEPADIDVPDPAYLVEDARDAVQGLRRTGIDVFAFGIGHGPFRALGRIVGERRALRVPGVAALPARVMQLYVDLKK
ncbi:nitric oxide reductase activation protein NorD [Phreatobacter stygius]|uniref:VWA domain-containing protein n=1 Tax=Phreatobacter stygius TaxID=1940610 RepID=A0A4D7BKF2_9HYPH|nr:VWA domain-containing protein [Phreatobacter stygius]QCI68227.1 VWA domain-containing protein [Phreatobacter stygius]